MARKKAPDKAADDQPGQLKLSTGSTMLNLACSDNPHWGLGTGRYFWMMGDSDSGKSWISLSILAEAAFNPAFAGHRLIYDNAENGVLVDIPRYFGKRLAQRIESPRGTWEDPEPSDTVEDFYLNVDDVVEKGQPFIYILDSMDALTSRSEGEQFKKIKSFIRKPRKDAKAPGSYGDGKAKVNSSNLRRLIRPLMKMRSILIIISQTRDNINAGMFEDKNTTSGGRALKFYASLQLYTRPRSKIKVSVRGKDRGIGTLVSCKVAKNRQTGVPGTTSVNIPIYLNHGIDDVGAMVDYLVEESHWEVSKGTLTIPEFDLVGTRDEIIRQVELKGLESELQELASGVWSDIREKSLVYRKPRYD